MNKVFLVIFFCFTANFLLAQIETEKLGKALCKCLNDERYKDNPNKLSFCNDEILAEAFEEINSETELVNSINEMDVYLSKTCRAYVEETYKYMELSNSAWKLADPYAESRLGDVQCERFLKYEQFYYEELSGDTTYVTIKDGVYYETLDGGEFYAELKFSWLDECSFQIEFVESNHPFKSRLSKPGDIYLYRIMDRSKNYYQVQVTAGEVSYELRFYFK